MYNKCQNFQHCWLQSRESFFQMVLLILLEWGEGVSKRLPKDLHEMRQMFYVCLLLLTVTPICNRICASKFGLQSDMCAHCLHLSLIYHQNNSQNWMQTIKSFCGMLTSFSLLRDTPHYSNTKGSKLYSHKGPKDHFRINLQFLQTIT